MPIAAAVALTGDLRSAVKLLKRGIKAADANGSRAVASWNRIILAEVYLAVLTARGRPQPDVLVRNLSTILGVALFGTRSARALLEEARQNEHFDERGTVRARIEFDLARLAQHENRFGEARECFARARAAADAQGASATVTEIDLAAAALPSM